LDLPTLIDGSKTLALCSRNFELWVCGGNLASEGGIKKVLDFDEWKWLGTHELTPTRFTIRQLHYHCR
jgi:hypothetical protein